MTAGKEKEKVEDVEMKDAEEEKVEKKDPNLLSVEDVREHCKLIRRSVETKEVHFSLDKNCLREVSLAPRLICPSSGSVHAACAARSAGHPPEDEPRCVAQRHEDFLHSRWRSRHQRLASQVRRPSEIETSVLIRDILHCPLPG